MLQGPLKTLLGGWEAFPCFAGNRAAGPHAPPFVGSLSRVVRIRNGHSGQYLGPPALKLLAKVCRTARLALIQVIGFAHVGGQVVKFKIATAIEVLNQLPVSFPNATRRTVVVKMGIVPVQGIPIERCRGTI